jgi:lysophospholipase L1-like esterase
MNTSRLTAPAFALALTLLMPAFGAPQTGAPVHWYASWTASPWNGGGLPPTMFAPSVEAIANQTVRQTITLSRGGSQVRVRLSNEYARAAMRIGAASLGYSKAGKMIRVPLTFSGAPTINVMGGAPIVSDPVAVQLPDGAKLEISVFFPEKAPMATIHLLGEQDSVVSGPGNFVLADAMPGAQPFEYREKMGTGRSYPSRFALCEVDVAGPAPMRTVVAFGDSITDGMGSTVNADRRWPDYLSRRIVAAKLKLSVVNQGIGGNQVLAGGMGDSALSRFDRDALALPGVSTIILMEGINDIGFSGGMIPGVTRPDVIPPEEIIQGYRQLIARAHARGVKVIGATMTPFEGSPAFVKEKEAVRSAVNAWIRSSGAFDAVVDFDAATRDPQNPLKLKAGFNGGDWIHLNDAGYEAMAAAIDLSKL